MYAILYLGLGIVCEVTGALLIYIKKEFGIGLCCTGIFIVSDLIFRFLSYTTSLSEALSYFALAVALVLSYFLTKIGFQKIGETSNRIFETWGLFFIPLMTLFYVFFVVYISDFSSYFVFLMEEEKNNIIGFLLLYGVGMGVIWIGKGVISYGIGGYFCLCGISRGTAAMYDAFVVSSVAVSTARIDWDATVLAFDCTTYLCFGFLVPTAWRVAHERQEIRKRGKTSEWKN